MARLGAIPLGLLILMAPAVARAQERGTSSTSPVSSPTTSLRNPHLQGTREVVEEVIGKLRSLHVASKESDAVLSPRRCREEAILSLRDYVAGKSFHMLEGEPRDRLRRALWGFPEGDLDACIAVVDSHLGTRSAEETWAITDVLARGALRAAKDPFTQLLDLPTYAMLVETMLGDRPRGYGLRIAEHEGVFVVDHVFHGYDAAEKGVKEGDVVVEVDGQPPHLLGRDEVQKRAAGDQKLRLRIYREGFSEGRDLELEAHFPRDPNVVSEMMPGEVAYLRIESFLEQTSDDAARALAALEPHHPRALILDLRDNPGGEMKSCERVAHLFLDQGSLICSYVEADQKPRELRCGPGNPTALRNVKLFVLVNKGTASASEMLAAALKAQRPQTTVVGEPTLGKDKGQIACRLASAGGARFLLVTNVIYAPPGFALDDRSHKGIPVVPTEVAAPVTLTPAEEEALLALRGSRAFENYLALHAAIDGDALVALAKDDQGNFDLYPGFTMWARGLGTSLTLGVLRRALRAEVRAWAVQKRGCVLRTDLRDDAVLRHAHELALQVEPPAPTPTAAPTPTPTATPSPAPTPTPALPPKKYY